MDEIYIAKAAAALGLPCTGVRETSKLLESGATIPFIARYRKEATGGFDEVQIASVRDELERLKILFERKAAVKKSLSERNLLSPDLEASINSAESLARLEDIYAPFKPKRRTRGTMAREAGLEPLARFIFGNQESDVSEKVSDFIFPDKGISDSSAALAGARDIIAEDIADNPDARSAMRELFEKESLLISKVISGKEDSAAKYRDYFDWKEKAAHAPSHRILAVRRGESEGFLIMRVLPEESDAIALLTGMFLKSASSPCGEQVKLAIEDSYKRLLSASTETYMRLELKKRADADAVKIFADNLRELLMAPPLGGKNVMAIDPGFRTGCKLVCLNRQGDLVHNGLFYVEQSEAKSIEASEMIRSLCKKYEIEAIAIGNGTAGRETENFIRSVGLPASLPIVSVNESGASIYSASEVARREFPNFDITVRGAVSIGRRLMDPLAELVKIDPQSIGVGQYQHDVNQNLLKRSLDETVSSCVNKVGVELNTASCELLSYVSGLNSATASKIVEYRKSEGAFKSRRDILKVRGIGDKAFEQAAGFLRISNSPNPLEASAVHPERYALVEKMASDVGVDVGELVKNPAARAKIDLNKYVGGDVGMPTLKDIMAELAKPGRDPREAFEPFAFTKGVNKMSDLSEGMRLNGIVTNVTAFGAFVDIGVHQDGLVHISQLSDSYVRDAREVVKPGQKVSVSVLELDIPRGRISLSMKSNPQKSSRQTSESRGALHGNPKSAQIRNDTRRNARPFGNSLGDAFGGTSIFR